jgi:hypothetical protein
VVEKDIPKRVVVASAASRKDSVSIPPSGPIVTSKNDFLWVSNHVFPGGIAVVAILRIIPGVDVMRTRTKASRGYCRTQGCRWELFLNVWVLLTKRVRGYEGSMPFSSGLLAVKSVRCSPVSCNTGH